MKMLQRKEWNISAETRTELICCFFIFFCFSLNSAAYLSWVYHLIPLVSDTAADLLTMGVGYLCQALGIFLLSLLLRRRPDADHTLIFSAVMAMFVICCIPAILSSFLAGTLIFGFLLNLVIGMISGMYLFPLASRIPSQKRGRVFSFGYGVSTIAVWLYSLIGKGNFLKTGYSLVVYVLLSLLAVILIRGMNRPNLKTTENRPISGGSPLWAMLRFQSSALSKKEDGASMSDTPLSDKPWKILLLAWVTVFFFSLVKNIGFSFSTADLLDGVSLELSRLLYAAGLILAGLVMDRSRKQGSILTLTALVTPFVMLALSKEPISGTIFWALDYFFYGFFSVFRVILCADLSASLSGDGALLFLSGHGLLFGRIGDALGTGICTALSGHLVALVSATVLFFAVCVYLFFQLYQMALSPAPQKEPEKTDAALFEQFASRYGLSNRERSVLRLVIAEQSNAEIAAALHVSESTIKFHVHNLLKKTESKNRLELTHRFHS